MVDGVSLPFPLEETARRLGNYRWMEMRLFETLGRWVATVPEIEVKMRLGAHCYKHAWHADLWHERMPELPALAPERLTLPPHQSLVDFIEAMNAPGPAETIEKLVGAYRVLIPHKIAAYSFHRDMTSPVADAPLMRSLRFVLQDELDDWREGEMMIQSLLETKDEVRRAAAHQERLETLMVEAGGIAGPGSIG